MQSGTVVKHVNGVSVDIGLILALIATESTADAETSANRLEYKTSKTQRLLRVTTNR